MNNKRIFQPGATLEALNQRMKPDQLAGHLGMKFTEMTDSTLTVEVDISNIHSRPGGIMSGGTTLAVIETVGSVAGMSTIDVKTHDIFGIEVNCNHVRQVKMGQTIKATASPEHIGRTTQIWNVKITAESKLVCTGRITLMAVPRNATS